MESADRAMYEEKRLRARGSAPAAQIQTAKSYD